LQIVVLREIPEAIGAEWNALVQEMERPEVFYTHEWALAVSRAYQSSIMPLLFLAYERDRLVGLVALATDRMQKQAFFLSAATADYCDFVGPETRRAELVGLVLAELQRLRLRMLVAANLPASSATAHAIKPVASMHGFSSFSRPAYECAQITLESPDQRRDVKLAIAAQRTLRSVIRSLERQGALVVEHLRAWPGIRAVLPDFIKAHIARFRSMGRTSHLSDPARQQFLRELSFLLSAKGQVVLSQLLVNDRPIAWNYGFQFAGSWLYYQLAFLSEWQRFSPGVCLLTKIVEAAGDDPAIHRVDLGLGSEGYKQRFTTSTHQTLHVTVTRSARRRLQEVARYHAASAIKSNTYLEHWVRRLLRRPGVPA